MSGADDWQSIAKAFLAARSGKAALTDFPGPIPQTMAEAYAIQDVAIALDGREVGGWKVGRIAPEIVDRYGAERVAGPIFADEIVDASDGSCPAMPVYAAGFAAAEAEVLLRIGRIADGDHDLDSIRECVDDVRVGFEIASSPFAAINRGGPAVSASDYANNKGLVLGPAVPNWRQTDLIHMPVEVGIDGKFARAATMENMLDGPFGSLLFLVNTLRSRGVAVPPGTWLSAGAITGVHEMRPGQHAKARFGDDLYVECTITSL